jgi:outer membrane protein
MRYAQILLSAAAGTALACLGQASAETLTLAEALSVAYESNPQLAAARAGLRATDEGVAIADSNFRPTINVGATYGYEKIPPVFGGTPISYPLGGQVQVTQAIFNASYFGQQGKAKEQVKVGRAQLIATEEQVLLNAVTAYMNVVRDEATVELRRSNVAVLQKQRDATQEQFRVGELTRTDVAQSQARLAGAQADLINAEGQLAISRSNFEHQVGRPAETLETEPKLPVLPKEQQAAIDDGHRFNPSLNAARSNVKAADYAVRQAIGALMPQLSVNGTYQYTQNNPSYGPFTIHALTVTGQLNVPIYQGGAEDATVRQAKELRSQAQLTVNDTDRQVVDAVRTSWQAYTSAEATIASNMAQVEANTVAYKGVKLEQQVGGRTILDVLNAEQELLNSQVALVSSKRDTVVAAYELLSAIGTLTATGLSLHVNVYDPAAHYEDDAGKWVGFGD